MKSTLVPRPEFICPVIVYFKSSILSTPFSINIFIPIFMLELKGVQLTEFEVKEGIP